MKLQMYKDDIWYGFDQGMNRWIISNNSDTSTGYVCYFNGDIFLITDCIDMFREFKKENEDSIARTKILMKYGR